MIAAVGQFRATSLVAENTSNCIKLIQKAASKGAKMIFLPEASDFIASSGDQVCKYLYNLKFSAHSNLDHLSQTLSNSFVSELSLAAKENKIFISVGLHEKSSHQSRVYNTHIVINDQGQISKTYRKLHLFDVEIANGPILMESKTTLPGDAVVDPVDTPIGRVGLGICYDLRFPEFSILLRRKGAQIITFPSAFTEKTGKAHWESLLRSRAIETQCYVIAAAQIGQHNEKRASFGRAMIVDPWGEIKADCGDEIEPDVSIAKIDLNLLESIRESMPIFSHRRHDVYELNLKN
ncbi:Carbon-nitrogen hydrolase [Nowakowskiella sp. JEL0078]|nr:Carbon-nitrogen hydrolase [Nowakowskiella sp. JEL0078]